MLLWEIQVSLQPSLFVWRQFLFPHSLTSQIICVCCISHNFFIFPWALYSFQSCYSPTLVVTQNEIPTWQHSTLFIIPFWKHVLLLTPATSYSILTHISVDWFLEVPAASLSLSHIQRLEFLSLHCGPSSTSWSLQAFIGTPGCRHVHKTMSSLKSVSWANPSLGSKYLYPMVSSASKSQHF